jgi:ABC-type uncharacterized transport system permease subunit
MYAFPMQLLLGEPTTQEMWSGFAIQTAWLLALSALVRWSWKRGLVAYEAYGG